jgi:hypothetical protein
MLFPFPGPTWEAVDPGGDGALVGEVAADAALVLESRTPDERGMVQQAVLGSVRPSFQRPEQRLLRTWTENIIK